ncbi:unnamed protein product [Absidia cylindrospora]
MALTEKQRMLAGELYYPFDQELSKERDDAIIKMDALNLAAADSEKRKQAAKELFGHFGAGSDVRPTFRCDYGYNIMLGERVDINFDNIFLDVGKITIGDDSALGPSVHIYSVTHPLNPEDRKGHLEQGKDVTIGKNCWIGGGAIILPGVSIGDGSTIGAGSVVTKDIPSNVLAVGNPAKVIKSFN